MILGLVMGALILGCLIGIIVFLITGKELNIHITHTHKTIEPCTCNKENPDTAELQRAFHEDYMKRQGQVINMDGVISEVNKVMGIEVPDTFEGDK